MTPYSTADLSLLFGNVFKRKRVWLSGHTGFKGSWLAEWLLMLGAEVHGYSLEPDTDPSLFSMLSLESRLEHEINDVRDAEAVNSSINEFQPDFVFHLAAQPLVRASYDLPSLTFETNVQGSIHVLEALRNLQKPCIGLFVTTDKCYRNDNSGRAFEESDPLGGKDPYSASKAAMEIAVHAYRASFFSGSSRIATARAGNVVGGGDYAKDRIVPDCIRSLAQGIPIHVRNPSHTRPWQHVLEPLSGYLLLAAFLDSGWEDPQNLYAFNFGPVEEGHRSVRDLVEELLKTWPGTWESPRMHNQPSEAKLLALSVKRAQMLLSWYPRFNFTDTIKHTVDWYRKVEKSETIDPEDCINLTREMIRTFSNLHA